MRVLVVDDDKSIRRTLEKFLQGEGYEVATAADGGAAVASFRDADVVLLDLGLPGKDGFEVLTEIQKADDAPPVVVVTARDDMQSTVRAVQLGAFEYLVKPIDIDLVKLVVARAAEARETSRRLARSTTAEDAALAPDGAILGRSPQMREVYKQIGAVSRSRATVLVSGESGTGKELVAKAVHAASSPDAPFVGVNCTSFASGVLESELFGHVRGAYTGASGDRVGRFEAAGAGTLFLDEIAEIPLDLQAKLLRVLQEKSFERVGDSRPIALKARIIAATHRDLGAMVKSGAFREDLYYRLQVVEIRLPPLRERPDDVPLLVEGLVAKINRDVNRAVRIVTPEAMEALRRYAWPGNVRELENTLTRAIVLAKGDAIDGTVLAGLGSASALPAEGDMLPLREIERRHIDFVLQKTDWNKRRACAVLEISRPTLDRKIEEYGLKKP
ncbi:MAG: sigma-54-dependent Fis family transcriptional regulator [Labilithrix sp.]|nr:sigma-54-dependent Fis family transcriptional regulator [Labilithrix sp.]MCW5812491.1 sigma-54-dependent Fis family transcriptional regulator [Labilithrix sp.]